MSLFLQLADLNANPGFWLAETVCVPGRGITGTFAQITRGFLPTKATGPHPRSESQNTFWKFIVFRCLTLASNFSISVKISLLNKVWNKKFIHIVNFITELRSVEFSRGKAERFYEPRKITAKLLKYYSIFSYYLIFNNRSKAIWISSDLGGTGGPAFFFCAQILATFSEHTARVSITCLLPIFV